MRDNYEIKISGFGTMIGLIHNAKLAEEMLNRNPNTLAI